MAREDNVDVAGKNKQNLVTTATSNSGIGYLGVSQSYIQLERPIVQFLTRKLIFTMNPIAHEGSISTKVSQWQKFDQNQNVLLLFFNQS